MTRYCLPLAALLGLAACHSGPADQSQTATTAPPANAPAPAEAAVASSPGATYAVYRGVLPGGPDSVTLHLVTAPQPRYDNHGPSTQGSYYGPDGHPYDLGSQPSAAPDSLVLADYSPEHGSSSTSPPPLWRLRRQPDGTLAGTVNGQATRLRPVAVPAGTLTFAVRYLADSLAAYPKKKASPKARLYWQTLVPGGGPAVVRTALAAAIARELRGDTLDQPDAPALPALYQQVRDTFLTNYRRDVRELTGHPGDEEVSATLNYDNQTATYVLFHQGNLLSLGLFSYDYLGGAHGMNTTRVASYDLRTGRRLRYDDIFQPTAAARLPPLLEQAVRPLVGLKPGEALDQALFVTKMPVTHNVFLTSGGVEFVYQPYEIASYAQGEVRVFLPLAQVRGLLRDNLPLPGPGGVAAR